LKNGGRALKERIHKLIKRIWDEEQMSDEWRIGLVYQIFKKGDKTVCPNYRGITLLNISYEILSTILFKRINLYTEEVLGEYQCGFRPNRSKIDQIFVIRQTLEKCYEYKTDLHMLFVDFRQDSINRKQIYAVLESFGVPNKLIKLVKMTLNKSQEKVLVGNQLTRSIPVSSAARQGDSLSAVLFNLVLHKAIKHMEVKGTI
jgi:sorting nexin-29